ncbi:hypothetical protein ACSBR1_023617 [Camellia fascicularis]
MSADGDYEGYCCSNPGCYRGDSGGEIYEREGRRQDRCRDGTQVTIDHCKERGYDVVNVRSIDHPKLLFDTEYYIQHVDGCTLDSETKRRRVAQCLVAAMERRASHVRIEVGCLHSKQAGTPNRYNKGISRKWANHNKGRDGGRAVGSFYVTDASCQEVNTDTVEMVRREIGGTVSLVNKSPGTPTQT